MNRIGREYAGVRVDLIKIVSQAPLFILYVTVVLIKMSPEKHYHQIKGSIKHSGGFILFVTC